MPTLFISFVPALPALSWTSTVMERSLSALILPVLILSKGSKG